jgi:hypothetical protein
MNRKRIRQYVMLGFGVIVLIASFGCSPESKEEAKRQQQNEQLMRGYGNRDTTPHPIKLPSIKR